MSFNTLKLFKKMVLPVRIELTTSALPRMRSTTELRQHFTIFAPCQATEPGLWLRASPLSRRLRSSIRFALGDDMTSGPDDRKERLAQALRDNLRRRKAQARAGTTEPPPEKPDPDRSDR